MLRLSRSQMLRILVHVAAWMGVFSIPLIIEPPDILPPHLLWLRLLVMNTFLVALYYTNTYLFIPKLFMRRKIGWYVAALLAMVLLIIAIGGFIIQSVDIPSAYIERVPHRMRFVMGITASISVIFVSTGITLGSEWLRSEQAKREMEAERNAAELSFLKSQVNPHFLFNTLNNLYALAITKPNAAPEMILKLSGLMRYMLHSTENSYVPLEQEIAYLRDFVALQTLRMPAHAHIEVQQIGETETLRIAPMLLIPLVENAFKHGVSPSQPFSILISVATHHKTLSLRVENDIFPTHEYAESGIGLANVQRRLELLYPQQHRLSTAERAGRFYAELEVGLG